MNTSHSANSFAPHSLHALSSRTHQINTENFKKIIIKMLIMAVTIILVMGVAMIIITNNDTSSALQSRVNDDNKDEVKIMILIVKKQ